MSGMSTPEARRLIGEFAEQGIHRTGWPADEAASRWICSWLDQRGIAAQIQHFEFPRLCQAGAFVEWPGHHIEGVVMHDGGTTTASGVIAPLVAQPGVAGAHIRLLEPARLSDPMSLLTGCDAMPAAAIVLAGDAQGEIVLRNAEHMATPRTVPVLQIASRYAELFGAAAARGQSVRVVADYQRVTAQASNVVADIHTPGANQYVVIMTPKSGWFGCAAERGGGLVIALALAAAAAQTEGRKFHVRCLFTSGHELGHWGLLAYLEAHPEIRAQAHLWIHLGASIGARHPWPGSPILYSREPAWRSWFMALLETLQAGPVTLAPIDQRPPGESREVLDHPFVSMGGAHRYFHSPQDTPSIAGDPDKVMAYAAAFGELLDRVLTGDYKN